MYDYLPKGQEMGGCPCGLTSGGPGEAGVADTAAEAPGGLVSYTL